MLPKEVTPRARYTIAGLAALVPPVCMGLFSLIARSLPGAFPFGPTWAVVIALSAAIFVALARAPRITPSAERTDGDATRPTLSLKAYLAHLYGVLTLVGLSAAPVWGIAPLLGAAGWAGWANRARARAIRRGSSRADGATAMLVLAGALLQAFSVLAKLQGSDRLTDWAGVTTVAAFAAGMVQVLYLAFPDGIIRRA